MQSITTTTVIIDRLGGNRWTLWFLEAPAVFAAASQRASDFDSRNFVQTITPSVNLRLKESFDVLEVFNDTRMYIYSCCTVDTLHISDTPFVELKIIYRRQSKMPMKNLRLLVVLLLFSGSLYIYAESTLNIPYARIRMRVLSWQQSLRHMTMVKDTGFYQGTRDCVSSLRESQDDDLLHNCFDIESTAVPFFDTRQQRYCASKRTIQ